MKRVRIIVCIIICAFALTLQLSSYDLAADSRICEPAGESEEHRIIDSVETILASIVFESDNIDDVLQSMPELNDFIHKDNALDILSDIMEKNSRIDRTVLSVFINYIKSGFSEKSILLLSRAVEIQTTTISGKTIKAFDNGSCISILSMNCHTYAWYYGGKINNGNCSHVSDINVSIHRPEYYFETKPTCYSKIITNATLSQLKKQGSTLNNGDVIVRPGDVLLYIYASGEEIGQSNVAHSAIVVGFDSNGRLRVKSTAPGKNVSTHYVNGSDANSYYYVQNGPSAGKPRKLAVYRPSHNVDITWNFGQNYKFNDQNTHHAACSCCGRGKLVNNNTILHTFTNVGIYKKCIYCGYFVRDELPITVGELLQSES
ncbi:MAG: hypothetical protein IKS90_07125 [Clostridia bacterium]|nr:hypothetical protein [Clostridia bacterium]